MIVKENNLKQGSNTVFRTIVPTLNNTYFIQANKPLKNAPSSFKLFGTSFTHVDAHSNLIKEYDINN